VVDIHYFSDDRSLVILLFGGDIATVQLEGPDGGVGPVSLLVAGISSELISRLRLLEVSIVVSRLQRGRLMRNT
jgi:hypothetical protein